MGCSDKKIIIAIDGFSSGGKSSFAKNIAARLGYKFIDTGAMYRAVTLHSIRNGAAVGGEVNTDKVVSLLDNINIELVYNPERQASDILLNGEDVTDKIRSIEVSDAVSQVSTIAQVRKKLVAMQQQMGRTKGIVMDGRDIGTVVFPEAELKIFLTADPSVRAQRRYDELRAKGLEVSLPEIEKNIRERDIADQNRKESPLKKAEDAIVLDNTHMSPEEQMEWVMDIINKKLSIP